MSLRRPIVSARNAKTKMEVAIAETTSAPRIHVIAIIKTQTMNNPSKYAKPDLVRVFIIAFARIYHLSSESASPQ